LDERALAARTDGIRDGHTTVMGLGSGGRWQMSLLRSEMCRRFLLVRRAALQ
jgi:hypothetical protein